MLVPTALGFAHLQTVSPTEVVLEGRPMRRAEGLPA